MELQLKEILSKLITYKDIDFVVDNAFTKQNKFLPSSGIPVVKSDQIKIFKPDYILVLPWNLYDEITESLAYTRDWDCKFGKVYSKIRNFILIFFRNHLVIQLS